MSSATDPRESNVGSRRIPSREFFSRIWGRKRSLGEELTRQLTRTRNRIRELRQDQQPRFLWFCAKHLEASFSQLFQDLFVQYVLDHKRHGFFCDFGATNGVDISNSYMLEKNYAWQGICAEPARGWHEALRRNRPQARIETDCVWATSGETIEFNEVTTREFSTINAFSCADGHARKRKARYSHTYDVTTISLNDLLHRHDAPQDFDYLSVDTEGSEFEILERLDFTRYRPKVVTVEHNFTPARDGLFRLFSSNGYRRVFTEYSGFDDWYVSDAVPFDEH